MARGRSDHPRFCNPGVHGRTERQQTRDRCNTPLARAEPRSKRHLACGRLSTDRGASGNDSGGELRLKHALEAFSGPMFESLAPGYQRSPASTVRRRQTVVVLDTQLLSRRRGRR